MKAREARQIRELLTSQVFVDWYERYEKWHGEREALRQSYDESVMHAVLLAGDYEGLSAEAHARFVEIDNDFEMLSEFEAQRQRTTGAWIELNGAETLLEEHRQSCSDIRLKLEAARKQQGSTSGGVLEKTLEMELRTATSRVEEASERVVAAAELLRVSSERRDQMWTQVEQAWSAAFRTALATAEYAYQARRLRGEAERVGKTGAEADATVGDGARSDQNDTDDEHAAAEQTMRERFDELAKAAEEAFECVLIEEFLYWPSTRDTNKTLCVPLIRDDLHLNVQVAPLKIYEADRARGLEFVEPVPDEVDTDEDAKRLHAFFCEGRCTAQ